MRPVPVLMYHHINPHQGDMVTITPEVFEQQMKYLHGSGYKTLKIEELLSYISGGLILREKAVVVTFDDGWLDNYLYAFPIIKKYDIRANIFIVSDIVDRASHKKTGICAPLPKHRESKLLLQQGEEHRVFLNWDLIREMERSGTVDFYSHTKTHASCDFLSEAELLQELELSKHTIEEEIGKPCPYLCWPYGRYSDIAITIAQKVGYHAIFTTNHGIAKVGSDPYRIKRIVMKGRSGWFKKRVFLYTDPLLSELYLRIKKK